MKCRVCGQNNRPNARVCQHCGTRLFPQTQVSSENLLTWYRRHRYEMAVLRDPNALFVLGFLDHVRSATLAQLRGELGLDAATFASLSTKLQRAGFVQASGGTFVVTALGQRTLTEIGLRGPMPPPYTPEQGKPPSQPPRVPPHGKTAAGGNAKFFWIIGGAVLLTLVLIGIWALTQQNGGTEIRPTAIAFATHTPTFETTNTPTSKPTVTRVPTATPTPFPSNTSTRFPTRTSTRTPTVVPSRTPTATFIPTRTPTLTFVPTNTPTPPPPYDIYVRRMDITPSDPRAGDTVSLYIMLASDTAPPNAPYFPESFFQWRQGDNYPWREEYCPPNYQYSSCVATVTFRYDAPGTYRVQVQANSHGQPIEQNTSNNFRAYSLTIALPSPGALSGTVQSKDGFYLNSAIVTIKGGASRSTSYGKYFFDNVAPGAYTVSASQPGYYPQDQTATIYSGQTTTLDFVMTRAPQVTGTGIKLGYGDCFDFDKGQIFFRPIGSEFWSCPADGDFQPYSKSLQAVNNAGMGFANPQAVAYENCKDFGNKQLATPQIGALVCLRTYNQRVVILQITDVSPTTLVFDWWGY